MPIVSIYADAGPDYGYGHLMRTLTLANNLDVSVRYLMRRGHDSEPARELGYSVTLFDGDITQGIGEHVRPEDGPVVLDSYSVTEGTLEELHAQGYAVMLFDDGKRLKNYAAAMVVDSAPNAGEKAYQGLPETKWCLGTEYYPLRDGFTKNDSQDVGADVSKVLVCFGGSDPDDVSSVVADYLKSYKDFFEITLVLGPGYDGAIRAGSPFHGAYDVVRSPDDLPQRMANADIIVGAAGGMAMEAASLGVPGIVFMLSADQEGVAQGLEQAGAMISLGWHADVTEHRFRESFEELLNHVEKRQSLSENALRLVDGKGAERLARELMDVWSHFRRNHDLD